MHLLPCPISRLRVQPAVSEPAFRTDVGLFGKVLTAFLIGGKKVAEGTSELTGCWAARPKRPLPTREQT